MRRAASPFWSAAALVLVIGLAGCSVERSSTEDSEVRTSVAPATVMGSGRRLVIVAIDSLDPEYIELNAAGSGPGSEGNWLMPNVRRFVKGEAFHWLSAEGFFPHATDMNHLNVVAGTNSGLTGFTHVVTQPEQWTPLGMQVGQLHLTKARYPDGQQVKTIFDLLESHTSGRATTAYVGNKNWVPEQPQLMYVLLGDLDFGQHILGAITDTAQWEEGPMPELPTGCTSNPEYRLVSRRNPRLYKSPILDLIRDVDQAFGGLVATIREFDSGGSTTIVALSDHGMANFLYRDGIEQQTDPVAILAAAETGVPGGLIPSDQTYLSGRGPIGAIYWRPEFLAQNPTVVAEAMGELRDKRHEAYNHDTGADEIPWKVADRVDMQQGRADLGLERMEVYNEYFVRNGVWPDLLVVMNPGWQITGPIVCNAGHGSQETAAVLLAISPAPGSAPATCTNPASLADVAATAADRMGWSLPHTVGRPLTCQR